MIKEALAFLKGELNNYIDRKSSFDDIVNLASIVDQQGNMLLPVDTVGMTLVNVDEERIGKAQNPFVKLPNGKVTKKNPVIKLNLYVLFTSYAQITSNHEPNNYDQGLEQLSHIVTFFQGHSYFDPDAYPALAGNGIDRLVVELYSLPIEQLNYLWAAIGTKYMPSVLYKVRLVTIEDSEQYGTGEPITTISFPIETKH